MGSLNVTALNDALANVTMLGLDTPPIIYFFSFMRQQFGSYIEQVMAGIYEVMK